MIRCRFELMGARLPVLQGDGGLQQPLSAAYLISKQITNGKENAKWIYGATEQDLARSITPDAVLRGSV